MYEVSSLPKDFSYTNAFVSRGTLHVVGYISSGEKIFWKTKSFPELKVFIPTKGENRVATSYKKGIPLQEKSFSSIGEYQGFMKDNRDISGLRVFGDAPAEYLWLSANVPNDAKPPFQFLNIGFIDIETSIGKSSPEPEKAEQPVNAITTYYTRSKKYYIQSLRDLSETERMSLLKKVRAKLEPGETVEVFEYAGSEAAMFEDLFRICHEVEGADILSGWYSDGFDFPYLYFRILRVMGEEWVGMFSPFGSGHARDYMKEDRNGKLRPKISVNGIELIDYMDAFKKYANEVLESYALDAVAMHIIKEGKEKSGKTLRELEEGSWDDYLYYNFTDVRIMKKIDESRKGHLINLMVMIAYSARMNFSDPFSPTKQWECLLRNELSPKNVVLDPRVRSQRAKFPGAYVHTPEPGVHGWTMTFDYNSEYPKVIMGWCIDPSNLLEDDEVLAAFKDDEIALSCVENIIRRRDEMPTEWPDEDAEAFGRAWDEGLLDVFAEPNGFFDLKFLKGTNICVTPSGDFFIKDPEAPIPKLMRVNYDGRRLDKKESLKFSAAAEKEKDAAKREELKFKAKVMDLQQNAKKVVLNAGYGAFGSPNFRFFDVRIARSVTMCGRFAIRTVGKHLDIRLNDWLEQKAKELEVGFKYRKRMIYSDTDSTMLDVDSVAMILAAEAGIDFRAPENADAVCDLLDKFAAEVVQPWVDEHAAWVADLFNAFKCLEMKREKIADSALWTLAKKHYAMHVIDSEGVRYTKESERRKLKGGNFVGTKSPLFCREEIKEFTFAMLQLWREAGGRFNPGVVDQLRAKVEEVYQRFILKEPHEVASVTSVNTIGKTTADQKGATWSAKAAIAHNNYIEEAGLIQEGWAPIHDGDKVKIVPLRGGNGLKVSQFAFISQLPAGIPREWIDYDLLFQKNWLTAMDEMVKQVAGVSIDRNGTVSVDECFG